MEWASLEGAPGSRATSSSITPPLATSELPFGLGPPPVMRAVSSKRPVIPMTRMLGTAPDPAPLPF